MRRRKAGGTRDSRVVSKPEPVLAEPTRLVGPAEGLAAATKKYLSLRAHAGGNPTLLPVSTLLAASDRLYASDSRCGYVCASRRSFEQSRPRKNIAPTLHRRCKRGS